MLITDVLAMTETERAELSDETIEKLAYGIKYADCWALRAHVATMTVDEIVIVLKELRARLASIEAAPRQPKPAAVATTTCSRCGCEIARKLAMTSATGTVCPDCYDAASN